MNWVRILAYVTGMVDQELLARNEYLAAENRILKTQSKGRLQLSDAERATLGEIGHRLGRKILAEVANVARPDTILAWYRKLVAHKFDGSQARRSPGWPRIKREVEQLIVRVARDNRDWGYDRIAGALANLVTHVFGGARKVLIRRLLVPAELAGPRVAPVLQIGLRNEVVFRHPKRPRRSQGMHRVPSAPQQHPAYAARLPAASTLRISGASASSMSANGVTSDVCECIPDLWINVIRGQSVSDHGPELTLRNPGSHRPA
jgi:hypothetical protein